MIYFVSILILALLLYFFILKYIKKKIIEQEQYIVNLYNSRVNMIPALYEVSENTFNKHDKVFENILKYRKKELYRYYIKEEINNIDNEFIKLIHLEELIQHEINFIFKISNKHPKLIKKGNFIYLRSLIVDKTMLINETINDYRKKIEYFNKIVFFDFLKKDII